MNKNKLDDIRDLIGRDKIETQEKYFSDNSIKPYFQLIKNNKPIYTCFPKQLILHSSHKFADEILYGGSAGGGKTESFLWDAYINAIKYPGINIAIFRRTYPQLERTYILRSRSLWDKTMGRYLVKDKKWVIYAGKKNSTIEFGHCQNENDVFDYHSAQYDIMYFDELTHWTEFQFSYLITRLRANTDLMTPFVKCATNPGGIGHGWVRKRWRLYDKTIEYKIWKYEPSDVDFDSNPFDITLKKIRRVFIPANVYDNLHIVKNDPQYIARLKSSPFSKQLLDGDWTVFSGQAFPEIDEKKHFIQSFEIPSHWRRWVSIDYGYSRPFCALWHAEDPVTMKLYTYKELYLVKVNEIEQADLVLEHSRGENIINYIADPSVFATRGTGSSIADVWASRGLYCIKGFNDRVAGWQRVHDWLRKGEKEETYWHAFADKCPNLCRTLPEMIICENRPEDIDTRAEDHAPDALRYFFMSLPTTNMRGYGKIKSNEYSNIDQTSRSEWDWVKRHILVSSDKKNTLSNELNKIE